MSRAYIFSTVDLVKGFYQVPVHSPHIPKTAFITEHGKFNFSVMPFGLRNAPSTFQRLMDAVLKKDRAFSRCYIDDISVFSDDWQEHLQHIRIILSRLQTAGLTLQLKRCVFGTTSCDFLSHRIGARYITPQEAKISAVANFCCPTTKKDVRSFLGLAGYYRRYFRNFSGIAAPLSDLTIAIAPDKVEWTPSCQQAFDHLKKVLTSSPVLSPPDYDLPFVLLTDASDRGIGAVLTQTVDTDEKPIAYFSRKLLTREQKYSATEKEGLAVVAACRHFLPYLLGRHFTVVTDHRALTFLHGKDPTSGRLARWFDALRQLDFEIKFRPGTSNSNANGLSRQS